MAESDFVQHYVCTREEEKDLVEKHDRFWVSNCGCREGAGSCGQSRMDVCLYVVDDSPSSGSGLREISRGEVEEILKEAAAKHLVPRPFRNEKDPAKIDGICHCCNDCCYYFTTGLEECDKGKFIESTDADRCDACGVCVDVCFFGARKMDDRTLVIDRDRCYGCGLCVGVCPQECIQMEGRQE